MVCVGSCLRMLVVAGNFVVGCLLIVLLFSIFFICGCIGVLFVCY